MNIVIHICTVTAEIITIPQVVKSLLLVTKCSKELLYKEEEGVADLHAATCKEKRVS